MSETNQVPSRKRAVERREVATRASFPAAEAKVLYGEDAPEVPILFIAVRMAAILLIAALVIARFIVAFGIEEFEAHWPRGRISQPK
jgi:hypothetical protein